MMKKLSAIFVFLVLSTVSHLAIADNKFVLEDATISSIHTAIQKHQLTCEQLVTAYIDRIKKYNLSVNKKAPINAIAEINPNVLEQARTLDQEFVKGQMNKPLFCILILMIQAQHQGRFHCWVTNLFEMLF
jgi:amidase